MLQVTRLEKRWRLQRRLARVVEGFQAEALATLAPADRLAYLAKHGKAWVRELADIYIGLENQRRAALASDPPDTLVADDFKRLQEDVLETAGELRLVALTGKKVLRGELGEGALAEAMRCAKKAIEVLDLHSRDSILGVAEMRSVQAERGTKGKGKPKSTLAWTDAVARHLHEAHPGPTDEAAFKQAKSWTKRVKIEGEEEVFRVYWHEPANALQCEGHPGQLGFSGFREKRRVYRRKMMAGSP